MYDNLLYVLPECGGCEKARRVLESKGIEYKEVLIDNPMVELGVKQLFRGKTYAPFLLKPGEGAFIFSRNGELISIKVDLA